MPEIDDAALIGAGMLTLVLLVLWSKMCRFRKPRPTACTTSFPGLSKYRAYASGKITLEEWRKYDGPSVVTEALEYFDPEHWHAVRFLGIKISWGAPVEITVYGRRKISGLGKWYGIEIWNLNLMWYRPKLTWGSDAQFQERSDRRGRSEDATRSGTVDRPGDQGDAD